jgi:hypothetical protein
VKGSPSPGEEPFTAFRAWLAGHRDDVSVVADDGRDHLAHHAEAPRVLASTVKVVHLLAYTTAVAGDPGQLVPLDTIATAMISESDNAAPDYLRARLGEASLRAAAADGSWPDADLRWFCRETIRSLFPAEPDLTACFTGDPAFRQEVLERVRGEPISAEAEWEWTQQTARGTARDLFTFHRHLATADTPAAVLARRKLGRDVRYKGGALPRTRGFGLSADAGTVAMFFTGTDFPGVSLFDLGLAVLAGIPGFSRDLGVRRGP